MLTLDLLLDMAPGMEMDRLVHQKLYGSNLPVRLDGSDEVYDFHPSTDINTAWLLAQKEGIALIPQSLENGGFHWYACDISAVSYRGSEVAITPKDDKRISCETAPLAICKCFLLEDVQEVQIDVQLLSDNDLMDLLATGLMQWREEEHPQVQGTGQWMAEYEYGVYYKADGTFVDRLTWDPCSEYEDAIEVQTKAIALDAKGYVLNLSQIVNEEATDHRSISALLNSTLRQRAEAAWMTYEALR